MKHILAILSIGSLMIARPALAESIDYTGRNYRNTNTSCELFAQDAYKAANNFSHDVALQDLLELVEGAPVPASEKDRVFQAIQLVWNNRLDNPVLAYTVAMGLCLEPKDQMAPMDDMWLTSPRTSRELF